MVIPFARNKFSLIIGSMLIGSAFLLTGCAGEDGKDGAQGEQGPQGEPGSQGQAGPGTQTPGGYQGPAIIGETTALIPQAGSSYAAEHLLNGGSGDTDFPYGSFKVLATVGEIDAKNGLALTGYPDGQAAWLLDEDTVRVAYQSESYATMSNETYAWEMKSGVTFTGSHIHTVYNVFGEEVDGKNSDPSDLSAKWGHQTSADGTLHEFVESMQLQEADFFFHSFCGAYFEQKHKYGEGIGFADDVWLNGEEWNIGNSMFSDRAPDGNTFATNNTMGLASIVVDVANETAYTVPALGQSGYEKILPLNPGHADYVLLVLSGYNMQIEPSPLKIYVGRKGLDVTGNAIDYNTASERDAFLARNGLLFGQIYGIAATDATFATLNISTIDPDTKMMDAYAKDATAPNNFDVRFYPTTYQWAGFDNPVNAGETEIYKWQQDGDDAEPNEQPTGYTFFNGDSKVEHPAVDPDITKHRYIVNMTQADSLLGVDFTDLVNELTNNDDDSNNLPDYLSASVTRVIAGVDGSLTLKTGGKGLAHYGDNNPDGTKTHSTHVEDGKAYTDSPDGLQWIKSSDGDYLIVDEDSGNEYGERKFILPINSDTMELKSANTGYFLAAAGGKFNPRAVVGVAAIPGAFKQVDNSEFSGTWNVTHLIARKDDNSFYTQEEIAGTGAQAISGNMSLAEQTMIGVVQHRSESAGVVATRKADAGGQIFMFNIDKELQ